MVIDTISYRYGSYRNIYHLYELGDGYNDAFGFSFDDYYGYKENYNDDGTIRDYLLPSYQTKGELKKFITDERNSAGVEYKGIPNLYFTDSPTDTKSDDKAFVYEDDDYNYCVIYMTQLTGNDLVYV